MKRKNSTSMFKLFKKKKKQQPTPIEKVPISFVYESTDGSRWYQYDNILQLPAKRAIAAEVATRFAEMNLSKPLFKKLIDEMKKHANNGDIVSLFALINEVEFRLDYIGEEETLLELATCYFCLEGEDQNDYTEGYRKKKLEIFNEDSDCKGFFLDKAFEHTTNFSNMSGTIIRDYLKLNKVNEGKLLRLLRQPKSGIMSTKSTI